MDRGSGDSSKHLQKLPVWGAGSLSRENIVGFTAAGTSKQREEEKPFYDYLQFLKPDPVFHARAWLPKDAGDNIDNINFQGGHIYNNNNNLGHQHPQRHLVLEALARKRNSMFLREFDFYKDYKESVKCEGKCFACKQQKMLWTNFPCQHLVWCSDCKLQAIRAAATAAAPYKCVVCDAQVHKIDILSGHQWCRPVSDDDVRALYQQRPLDK